MAYTIRPATFPEEQDVVWQAGSSEQRRDISLTGAVGGPLGVDGDHGERVPRRERSLDNQANEDNKVDARVVLGNVDCRLEEELCERDAGGQRERPLHIPAPHEEVGDDREQGDDEEDDSARPV